MLSLKQYCTQQLSRALVWASMLVVLLSLPRFLVVCVGPHCERKLELVHASGDCCAHQGAAGSGDTTVDAHDDEDESPSLSDQHPCTDQALNLGCGPTPKPFSKDIGEHPELGLLPAPVVRFPSAQPDVVFTPPTTGPPRVDDRTARLSTTVLRL